MAAALCEWQWPLEELQRGQDFFAGLCDRTWTTVGRGDGLASAATAVAFVEDLRAGVLFRWICEEGGQREG